MWLIAASADTTTDRIIEALSRNGLWVFVAICVLAGAAVDVTKRILKHKERIAMIQAGHMPDRKEPRE
jgi:hypothetical protein